MHRSTAPPRRTVRSFAAACRIAVAALLVTALAGCTDMDWSLEELEITLTLAECE